MKKTFIYVMIVCWMLQLNAQNHENDSINYDGVIIDEEFITSIPEMELTREAELKQLPSAVDNSANIYMPPIFNQRTSGSCTQCAEIGYVLTYELNRHRNLPAGTSWYGNGENNTNLYHPFFTYNFLNEGVHGKGTPTGSGFNIVKTNGCPSLVDYYDPILQDLSNTMSSKYWMNGSDKYINASSNTIYNNNNIYSFKITWNTTYSSLNNLKHWLSNHNSDSNVGGLAVIIIDSKYTTTYIPDNSPESGKKMVSSWGNDGVHALTIVGYNDDIHCFDLNNDGVYENVDTNGNGIIDLDECEKGAFKAANSWGVSSSYTTNGYIYIPYKLINNHSIYPSYNRKAYTCYATDPKEKELFLGFTMSHPKRENMNIKIGVNNDVNGIIPSLSTTYGIFNNQGGAYPMNGDPINPQPIDIALNVSEKYNINDFKKFFLCIHDSKYNDYNNAYIENLQLIDYRWNEKFALNKPGRTYINSSTTKLFIDYDLLPFTIEKHYTCSNDKVVRRDVNVVEGVLTINKGTSIDMYGTTDYNCRLIIDEKSLLNIQDSVVINAIQGDCEVVINGDVSIGNDVTFRAEPNATLKIIVNNDNSISIANCIFHNANLELNYESASLLNQPTAATISNCKFIATNNIDYALRVSGYRDFSINDNAVFGTGLSNQHYYNDGILIYYCGSDIIGDIRNNTIEGCLNTGLTLYSSNANIRLNKISKCGYGVKLLNTSNVNDFLGRCTATNPLGTQYIHDNDYGEVYIHRGCMPERFMYNTITNSNDVSLIIYDGRNNLSKATHTVLNIEYNNWGNLSNFDINNQLTYITDNNNVVEFDYNPKWEYGFCVFNNSDSLAIKSAEADSLLNSGNYASAKTVYQEIISDYPESESANNSMKKLLIAENMHGNNYESLQYYYNNDITINSNDNLSLLAGTLSNKCDENMEKYDKAIKWYESIIEDESTPYNDSIFATIDLGNLYLKMEHNGIKYNKGRLLQFIPKSAKEYADKTDEALRQLRINNTDTQDQTIPEDFWTDIVTSQPEGYVIDDNGDIYIHSAEALAWLSAISNGLYGNEPTEFEGVNITLENDIDLSIAKWMPIADINDDFYFKGNFNGNNHIIYNTILTDNKKGFIRNLSNANIQNLTFKNAYIYGDIYEGAFLTSKSYNSVIDRCFIEGDYLIKNGDMAPFIYNIHGTTISNCMLYIQSLLEDNYSVFANSISSYGVCAAYDNSHIYNCAIVVNKAHLTHNNSIGIARFISKDSKVENSYIHIKSLVEYPVAAGGLVSRNGIALQNSGTIRNCYFNRDIYIDEYPDVFIEDFDNIAVSSNDGVIEDTYYYTYENDYWQLKESIVYNDNTTDNLLNALNLGAERLEHEGHYCLKWNNSEADFDNIELPVLDFPKNIINIDEFQNGSISVYPNPANDRIVVKAENIIDNIEIYNAIGQLVDRVSPCSFSTEISTSDYNNGIYFVKVSHNDSSTINKLIISR
ncbi:MAG: T9SS type A sorting domain-containing protein [Bacteroidales bacterium]|nr:T9SS type A sorting domain-containing protein [Bacteroidales bacterium]